MKLAQLLESHHRASPTGALMKNLGDGYLLEHNPIFTKIRELSLTAGFTFSKDVGAAYLALPLGQLDQILASKKLPYIDNVTVLEDLTKKAGPSVTWNDISDNLRRNQVFHESCHAVARQLAASQGSGQVQRTNQEAVLEALCEESFANACEFLAVADATQQEHQIFLELNSYTALFEEARTLQALNSQFGRGAVLHFLILAYLQSNGLQRAITKPLLQRMCALSFQTGSSQSFVKFEKTLHHVAKQTRTLDERFRTLVTPLYLKMNGRSLTAQQIAQTDWLSVLEKSDRHLVLLTVLASKLD